MKPITTEGSWKDYDCWHFWLPVGLFMIACAFEPRSFFVAAAYVALGRAYYCWKGFEDE